MRSKSGASQLTTKQELILNLGDYILHEWPLREVLVRIYRTRYECSTRQSGLSVLASGPERASEGHTGRKHFGPPCATSPREISVTKFLSELQSPITIRYHGETRWQKCKNSDNCCDITI